MNLRSIANGALQALNPDVQVTWLQSQGFTNDSAGNASPQYAPPQTLCAQVQPLSTDQLRHMDNLNIQGVLRSVYLRGAVSTAVRIDVTGGDLLQFPELPNGPNRTWLVETVDEQWPNWCRATVRLQNDATP